MREYCWTCSCHTIKYVLEHYGESHCMYIDADMYFYQDPRCLPKEIEDDHCDVGIIRHGFIPNKEDMRYINLSGEYCVKLIRSTVKTTYVKKQGFFEYIKFLIHNERDFLIAVRRLYRALFRRRHDYISW